MMRSDYFGHMSRIPVASRWAGRRDARLAQRLAAVAARAVRQWMGSPPHRAVLLSWRFTRIGVGRARGHYGARATMWVAHVGRR